MHKSRTPRALLVATLATAGLGSAVPLACTAEKVTPAVEASFAEQEDPLRHLIATDHSHPMDVHWVTHDSFEEMVDGSALVVRGTVVESRQVAHRVYGWNAKAGRYDTPEEAGDSYAETPLTLSTLEVSDVAQARPDTLALGGGAVETGSRIEIVELGGLARDGHLVEPGDKPVLRKAEEAVFFLIPAGRHAGGYHVLGGWQGRLRVRAGLVRALGTEVHPGLADFGRHDGRDARELMGELRATSRH